MSETLSVVVEREIPSSPEKIWRALTQPHLIEEWLMKNDFKPEVGHHFTLRTEPKGSWSGVVECEVLVVEPGKTLSYTWGSTAASLSVASVVTLSLTPSGAGTLLRMEQSGFRPDQQQNYHGARFGWQRFITALETVLAGMD